MTAITVGSGLGGFTAIAPQPTYGGAFVTPNRPIYGLKSNKATHDPHIVQGGPYLEYGRIIDPASAHVQTWQDAKGTLVFDAMSSGLALLIASAFGTPQQLQPLTAPAFALGGAAGVQPEAPEHCNANAWSATVQYPSAGEVVIEGGVFYENVLGTGNLNKKPSTEATFWKAVKAYSATVGYTTGQKVIETPAGGKAVAYTNIATGTSTAKTPFSNPAVWQVASAQSGACFDMQLGVPISTNGEVTAWNYHSCVITKMELVFDRAGLVMCTFDWDAQYVENTTALIVPATSLKAQPFSMSNTNSVFEVGNVGAIATLGGVKKLTITLERKLATDKIYLGLEHKEIPSTNGIVELSCVAEVDYTYQSKQLLETFLKNEAQAMKIIALGAAIGTSGEKNTLGMELSSAFIQTGGEAPLDGPDIVKNTVTMKGTISELNEPALKGTLITADSTF
jgi:Phage tail tube protein